MYGHRQSQKETPTLKIRVVDFLVACGVARVLLLLVLLKKSLTVAPRRGEREGFLIERNSRVSRF